MPMNHQRARVQFIDFGRAVCDSDEAFRREWLVTNGIGGYASGTIGGVRTRKYHAMLVAAPNPPAVRTLLLGETAPTATYRGVRYPLCANQWKDGTISPQGHIRLQRFHLERQIPVWRWSFSSSDRCTSPSRRRSAPAPTSFAPSCRCEWGVYGWE